MRGVSSRARAANELALLHVPQEGVTALKAMAAGEAALHLGCHPGWCGCTASGMNAESGCIAACRVMVVARQEGTMASAAVQQWLSPPHF